MNRSKIWSLRVGTAVLFALLFSWMVTGMIMSRSFNLNCFYDAGDIYSYSESVFNQNGENWIYNYEEKRVEIQEDTAGKNLRLPIRGWNYLTIYVKALNRDELPMTLVMYDSAYQPIRETDCILQEGKNTFAVDVTETEYWRMQTEGQKGAAFRITGIQFSETNISMNWKAVVGIYLGILSGCLLVIYYIGKLSKRKNLRIDWYLPIEGIQKIYLRVLTGVSNKMPVFSTEIRRKMRISMMVIMLSVLHFLEILVPFAVLAPPKRFFIGSVFILMLTLLLIEPKGKLHLCNWKNPVVLGWFYFAVFQCVSDLIVSKVFWGVGYSQLITFGLLFFIWANQKNKQEFLREIRIAVQINYGIVVLFCILFRPFTEGYAYSGYWLNPNTFGHHLVFVCIALMAGILEEFKKKRLSWALLGNIIGLLTAWNLIWKTQSRLAIIATALLCMLGIIQLLRMKNVKRMVTVFLIAFILAVPVNMMWNWGLTNTALLLNTQKSFAGDVIVQMENSSIVTMQVNAQEPQEEKSQHKLIQKLQNVTSLDELTSGRISLYKGYLRKMNLFGHPWRENVNGVSNYAHNEWLNMAYRYGIFSVIPYILLWLGALKMAYLKYNNREEEAFFGIGIVLVFMIVSMGDCTELPFRYFTWIISYMAVGNFFENQVTKNEMID